MLPFLLIILHFSQIGFGVTAFYPQDITEIKKEMNVLITGFHVANRPVKKGDKSGNNVITDTAGA